jgi:hypothetical protein
MTKRRRFRLGFLWLTLKRLYVWLVKHESSLNRLTHLPSDLRFALLASLSQLPIVNSWLGLVQAYSSFSTENLALI